MLPRADRLARARGGLLLAAIDRTPGPAPGDVGSTPLGVPGHLFVDLLETSDEQLDPRVIREDERCRGIVAAEEAPQHGVEEEHRIRAEGPVRAARLEEMDRRAGETAELDFPGDALDELVALLVAPLVGQAHRAIAGPGPPPAPRSAGSGTPAAVPSAASKAWYAAAPRMARITSSMYCDCGSSSRTAATVTRAASSSGKPPTPVPIAGNAMLRRRSSRARAKALRTARSIPSALVRRSRSRETAWITTFAARVPAGVTTASPRGTGACRTAANSISSPPAR